MKPARWLTVKHAAEYLDFPSPDAFYKWARRNAIPFAHRGRLLIFLSTDLDKAIGVSSRGAA